MGFFDLVKNKLRELEPTPFDATLSGAHAYRPEKICPGYNLYDGQLIDGDGHVIKAWPFQYLGLLLEDGKYLAQEHYESKAWGLFDWDGRELWRNETPIHHDICVTPEKTILTFTKEMHRFRGRDVDFCVIVEYDMKGREISRWSTWDHFDHIKTFHDALELDRPKFFLFPESSKRKGQSPWGGYHDYYRLNSIQVLPPTPLGDQDSRFQEGNWLISFRHGSMLFILDKDSKQIVWKCIAGDVKDNLEGQHATTLLSNGNLLIFDNGRYRGWSRVIEINPTNYGILWEYRSDNFYTLSQGYAQRLPNGNTLVTQSEEGRAFEITYDKEIVWEFYHPEVQDASNSEHPESFGKRQWIYRMTRYPEELIEKLSNES